MELLYVVDVYCTLPHRAQNLVTTTCLWMGIQQVKALHSPTALCFSSIFSLPTRLGILGHMRLSSYLSLSQ